MGDDWDRTDSKRADEQCDVLGVIMGFVAGGRFVRFAVAAQVGGEALPRRVEAAGEGLPDGAADAKAMQ